MTLDELASDLRREPHVLRSTIRYLATRNQVIDEDAITDADAALIRDTVYGVEYTIRNHCPELH